MRLLLVKWGRQKDLPLTGVYRRRGPARRACACLADWGDHGRLLWPHLNFSRQLEARSYQSMSLLHAPPRALLPTALARPRLAHPSSAHLPPSPLQHTSAPLGMSSSARTGQRGAQVQQGGSEAASLRRWATRGAGKGGGVGAAFARGAGTDGVGYDSDEEWGEGVGEGEELGVDEGEMDAEGDAREDAAADAEFEALAKAWRALQDAGAVPLGGVPGERDLEAMFPGTLRRAWSQVDPGVPLRRRTPGTLEVRCCGLRITCFNARVRGSMKARGPIHSMPACAFLPSCCACRAEGCIPVHGGCAGRGGAGHPVRERASPSHP